jgi:predicted NBD/HSP70 family sugar kinase
MVGSRAVRTLAAAHGLAAADGSGEDVDAAAGAVRTALAAGPAGEGFLDELAERIALGAAAMCTVLDPGRVVLAGEVGQAGGAELAARVADRLARLSPLRTVVQATAVDGAPILRGAVITATDAAQEDLFAPPAWTAPPA